MKPELFFPTDFAMALGDFKILSIKIKLILNYHTVYLTLGNFFRFCKISKNLSVSPNFLDFGKLYFSRFLLKGLYILFIIDWTRMKSNNREAIFILFYLLLTTKIFSLPHCVLVEMKIRFRMTK